MSVATLLPPWLYILKPMVIINPWVTHNQWPQLYTRRVGEQEERKCVAVEEESIE